MSKSTLTALAGIAALAAVGWLAVFTVMPPAARGPDAPAGEFSAGRAFAHVQQVGQTVHVTGSQANDRVRDYLAATLRGLGLDPQVQDAVTVTTEDAKASGARVRNLVTLIPGSAPTGRVILVAHYDSVQNGPGANDDGAGVASLLETARALVQGPRLRNDVVLLLTDAEEACLCGAQAFVDQHPLGQDGGVVLNVEARGSGGPAIMFETSAGNADVVGVYGKYAPHPVGTSVAVEVYRILPNDTDFSPFRDSGRFSGLNSAYIDGAYAYHRSQDTAQRMDRRSLQHHGDNLLAVTRSFAAGDLAAVSRPGTADATYFPAMGVLVTYPGVLVWPLAVLALIAVSVLAWRSVRTGQTTWKRLLVAFGFYLVPIIFAALSMQLWWALLSRLQPGMANMIDPWQPAPGRWAVAMLVVAVMLGWWLALRRKLDTASLSVGALGWLAVFGVLMAATVPGGSYLTAIPALAGAAAGLVRHAILGPLARLAAAVVAVIVLAPTAVLFFPALGLSTAAAPALMLVFLGLALVPLADRLPAPRATCLGAAVLALVLTSVTLAVNRPGVEKPVPSLLMYTLDSDTGTAMWASGESRLSEFTSRYASRSGDAPGFPVIEASWTGPAQPTTLPTTQVLKVGQTATLVPQRNLAFVYVKAEGATIESVNGRRAGAAELTFHNPPSTGLELTMSGQGPYTLRVIDATYGLDGLPGYGGRPAGVNAAGSHSSDLVLVARTHS
ncbi:MAG TPA: M28 family peptidase [Candidatus Limnocylindrales bacterium]